MYIMLLIFSVSVLYWFVFRNPFLRAQETAWYFMFLEPVAHEILSDRRNKSILDIGSGTGKLIQMIHNANKTIKLSGVDTNEGMIIQSRKWISHKNVSFTHIHAEEKLKFADEEFDVVTICSVLFLLEKNATEHLLKEALRLTRPGGGIIVLTPSGIKSILSAFYEIWSYPFSIANWTFILWKFLTTDRALQWRHSSILKDFAASEELPYRSDSVFHRNATVEIILKPINN